MKPGNFRFPRACCRIGVVALIAATCPFAALGGFGSRSLYEKLAQGRIVVAGTCVEEGRRAVVQVDEVLRGQIRGGRIAIAYRLQNWERDPEEPPIAFRVGERAVMALVPGLPGDGARDEAETFRLAGGPAGKLDLPAEGADAFLEAVRRIVRIQSLENQKDVWNEHRKLLNETNPLLVEAGFQEVLKFRLGDEAMIPLLLEYQSHPRDAFRLAALQVLTQILQDARRKSEAVADIDLALRELFDTASGDGAPVIRAQAVRAIKAAGRPDALGLLGRLAAEDRSQLVRYEAQLALLEMQADRPEPRR